MAGRIGRGPIGNNNNNGFFSEANFKRLEKVVKLVEQYNNALNNTTTSLTAYKNIEKALEKRLKLEEELHKLGLKDIQVEGQKYKEQYENEKQIYNEKVKQQKQNEKLSEAEKAFDLAVKENNKNKINQYKELEKIRNTAIKNASKLNISEKKRAEIIEEQSQAYKELERNIKQAEAKQQLKENVIGSIFGTSSSDIQSIQDGTYKFSFAAQVFSKAVDTFKTAIKEGIDNNYNTAEKTLNSIVASNSRGYGLNWNSGTFTFGNSTYTGYKQINNAINDQLSSEGLLNNIYNTDILEATSTLTSSGGLSLESAISKAYQDTVIKYIVPYLDTSSETFTTLEYLMPGISKNVAATALSAKEQFGENQYIARYSAQLVELMRPVALSANKELYSAEYQEIAKVLEAQVANGSMDAAQAQKIANEAFSMYLDPTGTIQNGSVIAKMTTINAMNEGGIDSPSSYVNNYLDSTKWALGLADGDTITKNIIGNSWGISDWRYIDENKINTDNIDTETTNEQLKIFQEQVGLADDMNTTTDKLNKSVTNIMADVGDIKTALGDKLWSIGEFIVTGITTWIGAKIVGGTIGKSLGILGGSSAGGTGLGLMGGLVAAGGGILLGVGLVDLIAKGIKKSTQESDNENISQYEQNMKDLGASDEYAAATGKIGGIATTSSEHNGGIGGFFHDWGQGISQTWDTLGYELGGAKTATGKTLHSLNTLRTTLDMRNASAGTIEQYLWTFAMLADSAGVLNGEVSDELGGVTRDDIKAYMKENHRSEESFNEQISWLADLKDVDGVSSLPWKSLEEQQAVINWENYHRYGLDEVPYDNYPAILHEGEAVLTASTASTLRNLLDEYKQTSTQAVNFDTIIQTQTSALISKMEEIITTIANNKGSNFVSTPDQTNAKNILMNSMLHLTSTKSF